MIVGKIDKKSNRIFENEPKEAGSHLRGKGPKGRFLLRPMSPKITLMDAGTLSLSETIIQKERKLRLILSNALAFLKAPKIREKTPISAYARGSS